MSRFLLTVSAVFLLAASSGSKIQFLDVSKKANLSVITYTGGADKDHIVESTGNGVLILDYGGDGYQDLYFVNAYRFPRRGQTEPHANALYRNNRDGTFTDVSRKAHVDAAVYGQGGCVGDIDNDGKPDIYVTNFGPDILYHNNGDGTFTDITARAHVSDPEWSIGCTFFDADHDGDQDLYVANYLRATWKEIYSARRTRRWQGKVDVLDGPKGLPPAPNTFYLNNGDGTFTEATAKAGLGNEQYYSMGVVSFDYDNDGDIDLYVANDSTPNCLYRNRGNGTFDEVGATTGAAYNADGQEQGSMGVDFGDYDNDGWFDLIVTNFAHDYYTLYHNLKGQFFQDESFSAGIAIPTFVPLGFGTFFFDADHDGDLDLFFANGQIYPQVDLDPSLHETYKQRNQLFVNEGNKFREITTEAGDGFQTPRSGRGAAYGDLDNDGDLDIVVSNEDDHPVLLENESKTGNHWLSLQLADTHGSPLALGATVRMTSGKLTQLRQISSGGSYASQNDLRVNFGLGNAVTADRIVVRWPDGTEQRIIGLGADKHYVLKRGSQPEAQSYMQKANTSK
jgi:hypothetical protein